MRSNEMHTGGCSSVRRVTAALLLSFLGFNSLVLSSSSEKVQRNAAQDAVQIPFLLDTPIEQPTGPGIHRFTLRHIFHHGTYLHPELHRRKDIQPDDQVSVLLGDGHTEFAAPLLARSRPTKIQRLKDRRPSVIEPMLAAARESGVTPYTTPSQWAVDDVLGPNITDKQTVVSLAEMAANAYAFNETSPDWKDVQGGFNKSLDFGWEGDGLRGHIFVDEFNSTIVIGIKGTTPAVFDGIETTTNDKINDNLFASCCCAQQGVRTWLKVCDCATSTYTCNSTCVIKQLRNESRYYTAAKHLYSNVTLLYPDANVWLVGHSLGGAVSGLLGLTYGLSTVTFQSVPQALAAARLSLPKPPDSISGAPQTWSMSGLTNFGHTADPVYMGSCNGAFSFCSMAGYAFETQCHAGLRCVYDVVADKGWRVSMRTHGIRTVIDSVIKVYDTVPECVAEPECTDCYNWKFYESNSTKPSTSSSSSSTTRTRTRTETCKTPGWWGCLDETTTTTTTSTSSTSTTTTSTCKTPGWFGCLDETTTTTTTTSTSSSRSTATTTTTTTTTTCKTPGWFGRCNDETTATIPTLQPAAVSKTIDPTHSPANAPNEPPTLTVAPNNPFSRHTEI